MRSYQEDRSTSRVSFMDDGLRNLVKAQGSAQASEALSVRAELYSMPNEGASGAGDLVRDGAFGGVDPTSTHASPSHEIQPNSTKAMPPLRRSSAPMEGEAHATSPRLSRRPLPVSSHALRG